MSEIIYQLLTNSPTKGILVLDVDECVLWNHSDDSVCRRADIGVMYDELVARDWKVYFVTARVKTPKAIIYLKKQLRFLGYSKFQKVYMRPFDKEIGSFKYRCRRKISLENTAPINIMVGDQWTDIFENGEAGAKQRDLKLSHKSHYIVNNPDDITHVGLKLTKTRN